MRNYVIGTSDHVGRHLNMVQAKNIQQALEKAGVINPGLVPRRDMATHADVDYIYVEEPTGSVIDPVITRGASPVQEPVTVLHNFADRFVASQKPLPPEDYAILEQAVQEEFDKCEKEPEICKAIYYHIKHGIDDDSDLMDCYDGIEVHRLIEKFFATYFPVATVTRIAFDKDYIHYEEERPKWVEAYFSSEPGVKYRLDFIVRENDENNMVFRAEDSNYKNIASIGLENPTKFEETLEILKQKVDALRNPTEASTEIRTVGDLKAILARIPGNYAVTLGSDSVAVPDGSGPGLRQGCQEGAQVHGGQQVMIKPVIPVPLFLVELDPVDWDEYDSAAIACRSREILDELLDGAFARTSPECNHRVAYKYGFSIDPYQHVTSVTEIGTYTLDIPEGKEAVVVLSSFNAG